ncbi:MAG: SDR family NAD(P)-dependent oxidoreductase [Actinobacteria bacterium]|nr:SDR family NAD(P)-dependent oxidoreductase [Actinomycetota bacterium]
MKTIVITGASDGIGTAAAERLAEEGHHVVLVGRSPTKTAAVASRIGAPYHIVDFAELAQVRSLASELAATYPRIDVLANNAGGIMGERQLTGDGFEQTFQVNHLAPFLLTTSLMPHLIESKASVLQTSSSAAKNYGNIDIDDLQNAKRYSPQKAYGDAKLTNILFTKELHRRFHEQEISSAAFHPGVVATGFASDTTHLMRFVYHTKLVRRFLVSPEDGATGLATLAQDQEGRSWHSGNFYAKGKLATSAAQADDIDLARDLWDHSQALLDGWSRHAPQT